MKITNETAAVNSAKIIATDGGGKTAAAKQEETAIGRTERFDRYEGVSVYTTTFDLKAVNSVPKGIFSENTSIKTGEKILDKWDYDRCEDIDRSSAKHIISTFFRVEGLNRYSVGIIYEVDDKLSTRPWLSSGCEPLTSGPKDHPLSNDNVATIAAQVGKYIDSCYKQGKYSDEEYAELNDEIKKCAKYWVDCIMEAKVGRRLRHEDAKYQRFGMHIKKTHEEHKLEALNMRRKLEAENPFDINAFFAKIDQMRFKVAGLRSDPDAENSKKTNLVTKEQ